MNMTLPSVLTLLACSTVATAQVFNAGNLVVLSVNNNGTSGNVNSSGAAVTLFEYSQAGVATGNSVALASSGTGDRLVVSGSSTTEGQLSWSAINSKMMIAGYSGNVNQFGTTGTNSIATLNSTLLPRMAASVDVFGVATYMPITNSFSTNNIRAAASFDGVTAYVAGTNQPIRTINAAAAGVSSVYSSGGSGSWRVVNVYNGVVYASTQTNTAGGAAPYSGVYQFDNAGVASLLPGFPALTGISVTSPAPLDFMFASPTTLYVADDRLPVNGGGLQRWDLVAGNWTLTYTLNSGLATGLRSVTRNAGTGAIYAIAAGTGAGTPTSLVTVQDTGAGSAFTTLGTSATLTVWRGVEWVPCLADVGVQGGAAGSDGIYDNNDFVAFIDLYFLQDARADVGIQGGTAGSDGQWDNNDFVAFIDLFFAGCAS